MIPSEETICFCGIRKPRKLSSLIYVTVLCCYCNTQTDTEIGRNCISTKRCGITHRAGACSLPLQQLSGLHEKQKVARRRGVQGSTVPFCFAERTLWRLFCMAPGGSSTAETGLSPSPAHRLSARLISPTAASVGFDGMHRAHAVMASCCCSKRHFVVVFFSPKH